MNLTIPIMSGQIADIKIVDLKTNETTIFSANHNFVQVFKKQGESHSFSRIYCSGVVGEKDSLMIKGIGRNKRKCSKNLKLEVK